MYSKYLFVAIAATLCFSAKASADEVLLIPYEDIKIPVVVASSDGEPGPGPGPGPVYGEVLKSCLEDGTIFVPEVSSCRYYAKEGQGENSWEANDLRVGYNSCPDYSGEIIAAYSYWNSSIGQWSLRYVTKSNLPLESQSQRDGGCWIDG
ncbi:hypothetical protein Misp06_00809 [Microbulbifer sp. NBRC 101763]|uniref:hypothetical protein n=1 Tax=Microbulbifer sp. NBRC 101763 TaxID=1113820 RepID=UPI0030A1A056